MSHAPVIVLVLYSMNQLETCFDRWKLVRPCCRQLRDNDACHGNIKYENDKPIMTREIFSKVITYLSNLRANRRRFMYEIQL